MKSTIHDAATKSLIEHLSEIDKRHRIVIMQQKEIETKLAFAEEECKKLHKERERMNDDEINLRSELEKLLEEQQQLQLRLMTDTDRVRHVEEEEPLLVHHVESKLKQIMLDLPECEEKKQQVNELRNKWLDSEQHDLLHARLQESMNKIIELNAEKQTMELYIQLQRDNLHNVQQEIQERVTQKLKKQNFINSDINNNHNWNNNSNVNNIEYKANNNLISNATITTITTTTATTTMEQRIDSNCYDNNRTHTSNNSYNDEECCMYCTLSSTVDDNEKGEREQLQTLIQENEYKLSQMQAQHARQLSMVEREVNDLDSRAQELNRWLHDMEVTKQQFMLCATHFDRCFAEGMCIFCLDKEYESSVEQYF